MLPKDVPNPLNFNTMSKSVFLTRDILPGSSIFDNLRDRDLELTGFSLIEFSPLAFAEVPAADWIFFYSQTAIDFFFRKARFDENNEIPRLATMGRATAQVLKYKKKRIDFIGTGEPESTAEEFLRVSQGKRVIFPRAQSSRKSIQTLLQDQIEVIDLPVYKNVIKENVQIPECAYYLVTSPMNAEGLVNSLPNFNGQLIAIGSTTAKALEALGVEYIQSRQPSVNAMFERVLEIEGER